MLQQGDGRGERGKDQQGEEDHLKHLTEGQQLKYRRHGHKGETGTGGRVDTGRGQHREDHQPRQYCHHAGQQHHPEAGATNPFAGRQIGAVGGVNAQTDGEGEEGQPHGIEHAGHPQLAEVGHQEVTYSRHRIGQGEAKGDQHQDHQEQGRHHPA